MRYASKIDAYLDNELSKDELQRFENQMSVDESLAKAVEVRRLERATIALAIEDQLRGRIRNIQSEIKLSVKRKKTIKKEYLLIASAVTLILICSYLFVLYQKTNTHLAEKYYTYDFFSEKNRNQSIESSTAYNLAEKGDYAEAIEMFYQLYDESAEERQPIYLNMLAHCYFKQKEFGKSSELFYDIIKLDLEEIAPYFHQDAQWYWLLSELALGNTESIEFINTLDDLVRKGYMGAMALKKEL